MHEMVSPRGAGLSIAQPRHGKDTLSFHTLCDYSSIRLLPYLRNSAVPKDMDVFFDAEEAHAVMLAYLA